MLVKLNNSFCYQCVSKIALIKQTLPLVTFALTGFNITCHSLDSNFLENESKFLMVISIIFVVSPPNKFNWGIHLTGVNTRCSVSPHGGLPQESVGIGRAVRHRSGLS